MPLLVDAPSHLSITPDYSEYEAADIHSCERLIIQQYAGIPEHAGEDSMYTINR